MLLTANQLRAIAPAAEGFLAPLNHFIQAWEINTTARLAMFLAQCAHESTGFDRLIENLNYSGDALWELFGSHFKDSAEAQAYARQPERIADRVYANRNGNGPESSGDGWMFRGRGLIQTTGRTNYLDCSHALYGDERLVSQPDLLAQPEAASGSAAWFWSTHGCNELADSKDFTTITRRINGGLNGLADRQAWLIRVQRALNS